MNSLVGEFKLIIVAFEYVVPNCDKWQIKQIREMVPYVN